MASAVKGNAFVKHVCFTGIQYTRFPPVCQAPFLRKTPRFSLFCHTCARRHRLKGNQHLPKGMILCSLFWCGADRRFPARSRCRAPKTASCRSWPPPFSFPASRCFTGCRTSATSPSRSRSWKRWAAGSGGKDTIFWWTPRIRRRIPFPTGSPRSFAVRWSFSERSWRGSARYIFPIPEVTRRKMDGKAASPEVRRSRVGI